MMFFSIRSKTTFAPMKEAISLFPCAVIDLSSNIRNSSRSFCSCCSTYIGFTLSSSTKAIYGMLCFHRAKSAFIVLFQKDFEISRRNYARFGKQAVLFELEGKRMCTNGFCPIPEHCFPFLPLMGDTLSDIPHIELRQFGNVRIVGFVHVHRTHVVLYGRYEQGAHRDPSLRDGPLQKFESGQVDQSLPSWCSTSIHSPYAVHNLDPPGNFCTLSYTRGGFVREFRNALLKRNAPYALHAQCVPI